MENGQWYSQWGIALVMIVLFLWLFLIYLKPKRKREWRNTGILGAFLIALYAEMYGFPLTIYILSSVFGIKIPFTHLEGHLWSSLLGIGKTGALIEMMIGYLIIIGGAYLVAAGWKQIYLIKNKLAISDIYAKIRHPQYTGLILIIIGMLIHWPTLLTLLMAPFLIWIYYALAKKEEKEMLAKFGQVYQEYRNKTPMFLPSLKKQ